MIIIIFTITVIIKIIINIMFVNITIIISPNISTIIASYYYTPSHPVKDLLRAFPTKFWVFGRWFQAQRMQTIQISTGLRSASRTYLGTLVTRRMLRVSDWGHGLHGFKICSPYVIPTLSAKFHLPSTIIKVITGSMWVMRRKRRRKNSQSVGRSFNIS